MKASIRERREVTSAQLPEYLATGWKVLSWGTWAGLSGFIIIIGRA